MFNVDHTEVGIFQEANQICLCSFLQSQNGMHLEAKYCIFPLLGLFCGIDARKAVYELGGQYSFGTGRSHREPLSPASTSGVSSLSQPLRIPSGEGCLPQLVGASFRLDPFHLTLMAQLLQPSGPTVGLAMTLVTSPPLPSFLPPPSSSPSYLGLEGPPHEVLEGLPALGVPWVQHASLPCPHFSGLPFIPLPGCNLCLCHTVIKRKPANQKPEWPHKSHVVFVLNWLLCISKIFT